jgi:GNAT superfamily N-acetyltransferase
MDAFVRRATPSDASSIAAVAAEVWPEEPLDSANIRQLIAESARATLVAELDGSVVGFVDGFVTRSASGVKRWEVDLLAVSSAARGRGVGRRLVDECVAAGIAIGAEQSRGLVRVGNVASERVFSACGFIPDKGESNLWVAEGLFLDETQASPHVVPVRTFRYAGLWLEEVTVDGPGALRPAGDDRNVIGTVIAASDRAASNAAAAVGMQAAGRYHFWHRAGDVSTRKRGPVFDQMLTGDAPRW